MIGCKLGVRETVRSFAVVEVREDGDLELVHSSGGREGHGDFCYIMHIE